MLWVDKQKALVKRPADGHGLNNLLGSKVMLHPVLHRAALSATNPGPRPHPALFTIDLVHDRFVPIVREQLRFTHGVESDRLLSTGHHQGSSD